MRVAYNIDEAAQSISTDVPTITKAILAGELTARRIGNTPVLLKKEIEAWVERQPVWSTTE